ncbi:MAG TPA: FkbM family methyltransferase [Gaiellaceae bacterium]
MLKRTFRAALHSVGFDLVRHSPTSRARVLKEREISLVLDVGAQRGAYGQLLRRSGYRGDIVSIEPLPSSFDELQRAASRDECWHCVPIALGSTDESQALHTWADPSMSSLRTLAPTFSMENPQGEELESVFVSVRRLDSLMTEFGFDSRRLFLKLDVQGYEREVLDGAVGTLPLVEALEVELSLEELYDDQALMPELLCRFYAEGFVLVWLERVAVDRTTGFLLQADGIFVRRKTRGNPPQPIVA